MDCEYCYICNNKITDDEYNESCNFCGRDVCEKCYDAIPPYPNPMYGYVCQVCDVLPTIHETSHKK